MEEILKAEMIYVGRGVSKEVVYRTLAVILGMLMMCLGNQVVSRLGLAMEAKESAGSSRSYIGGLHAGDIELYSEMKETMDLSESGMDMHHLEPDISEYVSTEETADKMDAVKILFPKGRGDTTSDNIADNGIAVNHPTVNHLTVNYPTIGDREEGGPVVNGSAADNPTEENPAGDTASEIVVTAYGNGGMPEVIEHTFGAADFTVEALGIPKRPGKLFTGWYEDAEGTIPFEGFGEAAELIKVYAGWSEFPGFICNDSGYIVGCTGEEEAVSEGLLVFPSHESCIGVERGALDGLEDIITDIYIPANITYIEPGALDGLTSLMYIQADDRNPVYFSMKGTLYDRKNGNVAAYPSGRNTYSFSETD